MYSIDQTSGALTSRIHQRRRDRWTNGTGFDWKISLPYVSRICYCVLRRIQMERFPTSRQWLDWRRLLLSIWNTPSNDFLPYKPYRWNDGDDVSGFRWRTELLGSVAGGTNTGAIRIEPSGRFAYLCNQGSGDVTQYSIDRLTGLLYSFGSVVSGSGPIIASPDPTGRFLYSPNATGASIDPVID